MNRVGVEVEPGESFCERHREYDTCESKARMTIDILFLAKNRLEFTRQALAALAANTNWELVRDLLLWDDQSTDGTFGLVMDWANRFDGLNRDHVFMGRRETALGSPAAHMNAYLTTQRPAHIFAKIDSDVIVPPGWLDQCAEVMQAHPELDLLGIEPPASRTPRREGMPRSKTPERDGTAFYRHTDGAGISQITPACAMPKGRCGYAPCDSIGGIGLMRTRTFLENEPIRPHSIYGGFTEWQLDRPAVRKGWICPPLKLFLLDRMPMAPWSELSKEYEAKGWQRPWSKYPAAAAADLWEWWKPV